jgi:hypothetical protein
MPPPRKCRAGPEVWKINPGRSGSLQGLCFGVNVGQERVERSFGATVVVAGRRDEVGKALVKELRLFGSELDEASFITGHILNVDGGHTAN